MSLNIDPRKHNVNRYTHVFCIVNIVVNILLIIVNNKQISNSTNNKLKFVMEKLHNDKAKAFLCIGNFYKSISYQPYQQTLTLKCYF